LVVKVNVLFGQFKLDIAKFKSGGFGENPSPAIEQNIREKAALLKSAFNINVNELGFDLNQIFEPQIQVIDIQTDSMIEEKKINPLLIPAIIIGALLLS